MIGIYSGNLMEEGKIFVLVGICDDEAIIRKRLMQLCGQFKDMNLTDLEIICFSSGEELINCEQTIDILFLDIQMKDLDGLKTAEKIRENDESMIIVFLTGFSGYMQAGYRVKAFRYLLKPVNDQEFFNTLTDAIHDITKNYKAIIDLEGETRFVNLKDIIYVESIGRNTIVRARNGYYECSTNLNEWEVILNTGDFFRVHKAYIVNMGYIDEIDKEVLLDNGEKVEVSIRQIGRLKKACKEFRRRNAR